MGRNLIGYFGGLPDCKQYSVKIISDSSNNSFDEFLFAADSPFVVTYDTSNTPFDPIRLSRASISVLASEYFLDVYSPEAHGTKVILTNESTDEVEWVGFLTSNLLNQNQDGCNNIFTLEAQDCLYTLDKYDYETIGSHKSIVNFRQILGQIAERCDLINTMYIDDSMLRATGSSIEMGDLTISEQNFFSSDVDEPWTLREVLEEICKYLGYTATQYKDCIYLFDMQSHASHEWSYTDQDASMILNGYIYTKSGGWSNYSYGSFPTLATGLTLTQNHIMGTGADISLETIYNKIQVKDSFYEIDHFIPDFYDDEKLTNRGENFWSCSQLSNSTQLTFLNKRGKPKKEEKNENEHIHYLRKFDHENYTSVYRNPSTLAEETVNTYIKVYNVEQNQVSDNEDATGTYTVTATFKNTDTSSHSIVARAALQYDWYDTEENIPDTNEGTDSESFTLSAGAERTITLNCSALWVLPYQKSVSYGAWYTLDGGTKEYSISENGVDDSKNYIGATVVDLATFDKPMDTRQYNYETEANISFSRYIMVHQYDKPDRMHPYATWKFLTTLTALNDSEIESHFPCIMRMGDYFNPMIVDNKAYLALDATAIFERYNIEYINPDWTDENTNMNGLGLFNKTDAITTVTPALIFKLRIGDKYWSSRTNSWTTTDSCFVVPLSTDITDEDDVDYTGWWNEDHTVLNNISWTDWAGLNGYKIPLDTSLDFSQEIEFDIMMPTKMQVVDTDYDYDGMNQMCWIKDLSLEFTTKDSEVYDLSDIIYENVIDSGSVNTLSNVTCKITTYPGDGMHGYSNVALDGVLIEGMKKVGLDSNANIPEENIIKAYTNQYHTATIKQTMTLDLDASPFSRIKDTTLDNRYFGILGTTIDYAKGSQVVTMIETKQWDTNLD